jgi:hypothetical protein
MSGTIWLAISVCAALAGAGLAQDRTVLAVQADAREAAKREMAVILLQQKQTRPTGSQSTPEQDRIGNLIAADYAFVQTHRAQWRGTRYLAVFDQAFNAALHDPALKKMDPLQLDVVRPGKVGLPYKEPTDHYPYFVLATIIGGIFFGAS